MAVRLPDFTALGGVETGAVNVRPGDITPRYYGEDPEAAALARSGAALGTLGTGLERAGTGLAELQSHANLVNNALARAQLHTLTHRTLSQIEGATDPSEIDQYYNQLGANLESASQLITDPGAREAWKAYHSTEVADAQLKAEHRQRQIYGDRFRAGGEQQEADLKLRAATSPDPAVREQARNDLGILYSSLATAGVISHQKAVEEGNKANQQIILGHLDYLRGSGRTDEALAYAKQNLGAIPAHLGPLIHELQGQADTQSARAFVRGLQPGGGGPVGPPPSGPVDPAKFTAEATSQGVDPALVHATADIESSYGKNTGNKISPSNTGIFQRAPADKPGGMNDSYENQIKLGVGDLVQERDGLRSSLGREPTNAEVYLAHQQGVSGATKLINNPDTPAGQLVPPVNISNNAGDPSKPASAFTQHWKQAYDRREAPFRGTQVAAGPIATTASGEPPIGPSGQTTAELAASVQPGAPAGVQVAAAQPQAGVFSAMQPVYNSATGKFEQRARHAGPETATPGEAPTDLGTLNITAPVTPAMAARVSLSEKLRRIEATGNSPEWKAKAVSEAHRAESEFQSIHHAERVELDQQMKSDLASRAATGVGNPNVTPERIAFLEGPDVAQKHVDQQDQMGRFYRQTSDFSALPPNEMNARVAEMAPQPGQENFVQQDHLHKLAATKQQQISKLRNDDPALAVSQAPAVTAARAAAAATPNDPVAYQAYAGATLAEQQRLGILPENQAVLTRERAAVIASQFANADPGTVDQLPQIAALAEQYGPHFPRVMGDLVKAGLPDDTQVLSWMSEPSQVVAAQDYQRMIRVQAEKGGHAALKNVAGADKVKDIENEIKTNTVLSDFQATTPDVKVLDIAKKGIENLALYYAFRGKDGTTAARDAAANILGVKYDFEGPLRVPKGQLGVIERAGDVIKHGVTPEQLRLDMPGRLGLPKEYNREVMADAIKRGYWMTNEKDDGAVLYLQAKNGATVVARKADGSRFELPFSQAPALAEYAAPRIPEIPLGQAPF